MSTFFSSLVTGVIKLILNVSPREEINDFIYSTLDNLSLSYFPAFTMGVSSLIKDIIKVKHNAPDITNGRTFNY